MPNRQKGSFKSRQSSRRPEKHEEDIDWLKYMVESLGYDYRVVKGIIQFRDNNNIWKPMDLIDFLCMKFKMRQRMYEQGDPRIKSNMQTEEFADALQLLLKVGNEDFLIDLILHYRIKLNTHGELNVEVPIEHLPSEIASMPVVKEAKKALIEK